MWTPRKMRVICSPEYRPEIETMISVEGKFRGNFVIHPTVNQEGFTLSHLLTGLFIVKDLSEEDCMKVVEWLEANCPQPFLLSTKDEVVKATPPKVVEWLKNCTEFKRYVEVG